MHTQSLSLTMKKLILLFLLSLFTLGLIFTSCKMEVKVNTDKAANKILVGVFDKNGDSPYCITDAMEALKIDPDITCKVISASEIVSGALDDYDVILFPGGGGRSETSSLGQLGMEKVRKMVMDQGKGVVGICAGAYILSNTPNYPCLAMSGGEAIDIEHDHRGHGLAKFALTTSGNKLFPELKDREFSFCQYYEGPVLIPSKGELKYTSLATMLSDVHTVEGTPSNMTNNRPFVVMTEAGKGKTVSFVGHPECTPGMRWMIPRMVRWACNKKLISYSKNVVRPEIYSQEIIFTSERAKKQSKYYNQLTGTTKQKIEAINGVIDMACWSAKKWVPGMLRDKDPKVRIAAANGLVRLERTDAIDDVKAALDMEIDPVCLKTLEQALKQLENIKG